MIHLITPGKRRDYVHQLDEMFQLRHQILKRQLEWEIPSINGRQIDAYDHPQAVYLLHCDSWNRVNGCVRLVSSESSNAIRETFSSYVEENDLPQAAHIWEISRFCFKDPLPMNATNSDVNHPGLLAAKTVFLGIVEFCLGLGIDQLVALLDYRLERLMREHYFTTKRLGRPRLMGNLPVSVILVDINEELYRHLQYQTHLKPLGIWEEAATFHALQGSHERDYGMLKVPLQI